MQIGPTQSTHAEELVRLLQTVQFMQSQRSVTLLSSYPAAQSVQRMRLSHVEQVIGHSAQVLPPAEEYVPSTHVSHVAAVALGRSSQTAH